MSEPRTKPRWGWWITTGLVMCLVAAALRIGLPTYRRNCAIAAIRRLNFTVITQSRRPDWLSENDGWGWTAGFDSVDNILNVYPNNRLSRKETLVLLSQIRAFRELNHLSLRGITIEDADLCVLECFPNLEGLGLGSTSISGDGLKYLPVSSNLRQLDLTDTRVDDVGLEHVSRLTKFTHLYLDRTGITNTGLKHLAKLPNLRELTVSNTAVTDAGLDELLKTHPTLSVSDD